MPYKILKRGKEYILKSPTREYKHKTLAKAKAQKRLLEEKELKQKQTQKQKQVVIVNVNAPSRRRTGPVTKREPIVQRQEQVIRMIPSITPFGIQEQMAQARPLQKINLLSDDDRLGRLEKSIEELREPFLKNIDSLRQKQEQFLTREKVRKDADFFKDDNFDLAEIMGSMDTNIFQPRVPTGGGRSGITRQLTIDSEFNGATIGQLLEGDYGETTRGQRTEPTKRQQDALRRWKEQNP